MPDFDIDFDVEGRDRVIGYVREKYGNDKVCQISTFGSLGAKAALRGVARVLDFPYSQADKIAKLIPNVLNITLEEAIAKEPELARLEREGEEHERKLIANGKALEGLNSNLSTHAAGVIIMDADITQIMPICTPAKGEGIQSMYSMKWAEHQGAVKFDFLGLLNLTIIENALELINRGRADNPLDIDAVPLDDEATYRLLSKADTTGVFQLESGGMRRPCSRGDSKRARTGTAGTGGGRTRAKADCQWQGAGRAEQQSFHPRRRGDHHGRGHYPDHAHMHARKGRGHSIHVFHEMGGASGGGKIRLSGLAQSDHHRKRPGTDQPRPGR